MDPKTNWSLCCLCQKDIPGDKLRHPREKDGSYEHIAHQIPRFKEWGGLDFLKGDPSRLDEGQGILKTLFDNKAGYHKKCYSKFNKKEEDRVESRFRKRKHQSITDDEQQPSTSTARHSPKKLRSGTSPHTPAQFICCYCELKDNPKQLQAVGASANVRIGSKEDRQIC